MAAATAATVALPGLARAIDGGGDVKVFRGRYVFEGDRMIDGYMVSPRNTARLDTVVLLHGEGGLDAATLATARRYAGAGKMVVVPDLAATYRGLQCARRARRAYRRHQAVREALRPARARHGQGRVDRGLRFGCRDLAALKPIGRTRPAAFFVATTAGFEPRAQSLGGAQQKTPRVPTRQSRVVGHRRSDAGRASADVAN